MKINHISLFLFLISLLILSMDSTGGQFSSGDVGLDDDTEEGDEMHLTTENDEDDEDAEEGEEDVGDDELGPDDEDDELDPDDNEYSGSETNISPPGRLTICQQLRFENEKISGAFRPQCEPDGSFREKQCHPVTRECWCVDWHGVEIPNTIRRAPEVPLCQKSEIVVTYKPVNRGQENEDEEGDDIIIEEGATKPPIYVQKSTGLVNGYSPDDDDDDDDADVINGINENDKKVGGGEKNSFVESLKDPIVFAALVGGTVLGLLFIILFVMFTVYRMKKKDEGVYDLDRQNKFSSIAYTQHKHVEYFA